MTPRVDSLSIWMYGRHVATLTKARRGLSLSYTREAQDAYDLNMPLLSISLPLGPRVLPLDASMAFLDGLLPEGEARRMLAHDLRIGVDDTFGLLAALGRDCAGALTFLPEGEVPPAQHDGTPSVLSAEALAARLRRLHVEPLGVDGRVRISLAGVQQKLVLSRLPDGSWGLPIDGRPSTHILKRADPRFPAMVLNEAFCLAIGRHLGIAIAKADVMRIPEPILVVERFDRQVDAGGRIRRVHQEDVAQALGVPVGVKYEQHGGPGLIAVARLLREQGAGHEDLLRLLDITVLNVLVGNADAHAKNLSLLHFEPGVIRLAPAYDIVSTAYYPQVDTRPAMAVNGKTSINEIGVADVVAESTRWRLAPDTARMRIESLLAGVPRAIEAAAAEIPDVPRELVALVRARFWRAQ